MSESGAQLFARLGAKVSLEDLGMPIFSDLQLGGLRPGDVVEFCGFEGSGKSELLLNIAATCVLPKECGSTAINGRGVEAVLVSTDNKFDLLRLVSILEGKVISSEATAAEGKRSFVGSARNTALHLEQLRKIVEDALSRLHVVCCHSSSELVVSLQFLRSFIHNNPEACVVLLDDTASFYWMDRLDAGPNASLSASEHTQRQCVDGLKMLVADHHLVVFLATRTVEGRHDNSDFMTRAYKQLVRFKYFLTKTDTFTSSSGAALPAVAVRHTARAQLSKSTLTPHRRFLVQLINPPPSVKQPTHTFLISQNGVVFL